MIAYSKEILSLALAFLLSVIVTRVMIVINIKDIPVDRSSHKEITPRAGGVGLLSGFYISLLSQGFFRISSDGNALIVLLSAAAIIAGLGLLDDIKGSSPILRLFIQIVISCFFVSYTGAFKTVPLPYFGEVNLGILSLPLSILWIVGFTNAFNFMDGLNGMSGLITVIACTFLSILISSQHPSFIIFLILAAATLGFLIFNFPKAKIFLGDIGSFFLGFFFASWALIASQPSYGKLSIWIVPLLFFIYIYDVIFTRIHRIKRGKNFFEAHREHLYQLLNSLGWSHVKVTSLYALIFILQGISSLFMMMRPPEEHVFFFIPFLIGASVLSWWVFSKTRKINPSF
ncbi:MAG: hypothetical protein BGO77_07910 [Caedibacter sp. 37-49]|nr:MAG: hypothetical protein BGO77_07910 [Caedibacter sp. 37-49]